MEKDDSNRRSRSYELLAARGEGSESELEDWLRAEREFTDEEPEADHRYESFD